MANNRLWIMANNSDKKLLIAKYYPGNGWYCFYDNLAEKLNEFFDKAGDAKTLHGSGEFRFETEEGADSNLILDAVCAELSRAHHGT